jgi:hypothetical protein
MAWGATLPTVAEFAGGGVTDPIILGDFVDGNGASIGSSRIVYAVDNTGEGGSAAEARLDISGFRSDVSGTPGPHHGRFILGLNTIGPSASGQLFLEGPEASVFINQQALAFIPGQHQRMVDRGPWDPLTDYVAGDLVYFADGAPGDPTVRLWVLVLFDAIGDPDNTSPSSFSDVWKVVSPDIPMALCGDGALPAPNLNATPGAPGSWYYRNHAGAAQAFVKASAADGDWTAVTLP